MAGLLHDIGKIGITDQVLSKPGKLTSEEFKTVQQHPVIGSRIISSVKQLHAILPGVLYHHERYNGSGYPEGLRDEQIPLMGSIVGLADCFDAITSDRTYHKAMSFQDALSEIHQCSGRQFSEAAVHGLLICDLTKLEMNLRKLATNPADLQLLPRFNWLDQCR
jgi:HD-GYP domain-containing protein (c-di-GMP phosphodiesterase class II)